MDTSTKIEPGTRLRLYYSPERRHTHYATPTGEVTLCGLNVAAKLFERRGLVEASNVFVQKLVGTDRTRRLSAKFDCLECMKVYATSMRPYQNGA